MKRNVVLLLLILLCSVTMATNNKSMEENKNKLAVLWTSGDPEVAEKMAFMYTYNAKKQGWFDEVVLIIWGPSAKLTAENEMIQDYIKKMQEAGVKTEACLYCAKMYGVDEKLAELGVDVKGMGIPLSDYLKDGWKTLSL
ncbi:DsrE family protein [Draconibacterium sp. IB214405]|uniref:DsrE family protein n=1 Tax=Draconibacterium sp. IB214405 TaxID=3097352 RepID=UPI002A10FE61|nr:DsrE family protein [Draconibacterium sp. IB214405]MDX8339719.1 DsrE family protein [Draconibacterium sp. IB214405]